MGHGDRYVRVIFKRRPQQVAAMRPVIPSSGSPVFLRVWSATYLVDEATSTHTGRTVSGMTREEVMASAWRRTPEGCRLVYIGREDDMIKVWAENEGFTPAADEPHVFRSAAPGLFKDVGVGESVTFSYDGAIFQKTDDTHFSNLETGQVFESDPFRGVY